MPEESTTPDLVELVQRSWEPMASLDVDGIMSFYAPDAVYDFSPIGMGVFRGRAAIREFVEDWLSSYDRIDWRLEHVANLGNGVTISVTVQKAQLGLAVAPARSQSDTWPSTCGSMA
jgi:ketosteroid isomerase-like protein